MQSRSITQVRLAEGGNIVRQGHHFTQGFIPQDSAGVPVDLSGKNINVTIFSPRGIRYETTGTYEASTGIVRYTVKENIGNGRVQVEFTVTDPANPDYREKFPSAAKDGELTIIPSSDDIDFVGVKSTTVAQLRNEQQAAFDQYEVMVDGKIETFVTQSEALRAEFDAAVAGVTVDSEVILARGGEPTLKAALDKTSTQLADLGQQTIESDYVNLLSNLTYFTEMSLIKTHDATMQQFDLYLKNGKVTQKMTFAKPDDYFKLSGVSIAYTNSIPVSTKLTADQVTYSGNWVLGTDPSQIKYARNVGDYEEFTFTTEGVGSVKWRHFADNRGGKMTAVLNGSQTFSFSVFNATSATLLKTLFTDVPAGTHTVRITFDGADPNNAPSGGVARGWAYSATSSGVTVYHVEIDSVKDESSETLLMANTSNKEYAFSIAPEGSTNFQWIPQHATATTVNKSAPVFILDGVQKSLSDFTINTEYKFKDFKFLQDVYGRNPDSGTTNLVNVTTIHTITLDGKINVSGSMKVLQNTKISSSYVIMAPVNNQIFDVIQTGWGSKYPAVKTDNTSTTLAEKEACSNYIFLSSISDHFVAFRHTDQRGNFDKNGVSLKKYHNFTNHRDANLVKHYINIFENQTLPAGYKYRWSGDYICGAFKNVYGLVSE